MMRICRRSIAPLLIVSLCLPLAAADSPAAERKDGKKHEAAPTLKTALRDGAEIWTAPFHLTWKKAAVAGAALAVTAVLIANDESIYRSFRDYRDKHKWVRDVSPQATRLGEFAWPWGISGAFILGGMAFGDDYARNTGWLAIEAMLHSGLVVQLGKHLGGRQRPSYDNGIDHWAGPAGFFKRYRSGDSFSHYDAFPSGHTVTAFSLATVIASRYPRPFLVPLLCYAAATACGLSRLTEDAHWLSDVFVGAAVGYAVGRLVVRNQKKRNLQVVPLAGNGTVGLSVTLVR
jgi:membrane-associated phospholipid phosphatase